MKPHHLLPLLLLSSPFPGALAADKKHPSIPKLKLTEKAISGISPDDFLPSNTTIPGLPPQIPATAAERTPADLTALCSSAPFRPTAANYAGSHATLFLRLFTAAHPAPYTPTLPAVLATHYLGAPPSPPSCRTIASAVDSLPLARALFLVLSSTHHLSTTLASLDHVLLAAQTNAAAYAPQMARLFFWAERTHAEKVYQALMSFFNTFLQVALATAAEAIDVHALVDYCAELETILGDRVAGAASAAERAQWTAQLAAARHRTAEVRTWGAVWRYGGMGVATTLIPDTVFSQTSRWVAWEGQEKSAGENGAALGLAIAGIAERARLSLRRGSETLWTSAGVIDLLDGGAWVSGAGSWGAADLEQRLTKAIALRALGAAWRSQTMWIACTRDWRAPDPRRNSYAKLRDHVGSCDADRSGPQELKACVDGRACYLYKWNSRGAPHAHQVERPYGWQAIGSGIWEGVSIADVITGSVRTHDAVQRGEHVGDALDAGGLGPALWDPAAVGVFAIPVCESAYNFQGPVEPVFSLSCDTDPWCRKKALPCYCGAWGNQTRELWDAVGLWEHRASAGEYRQHLCPRRIKSRVEDGLEDFVALCRLEVHRWGWGGVIKLPGRHAMCGVVIEAIETLGAGDVEALGSAMRAKLGCLAGTARSEGCRWIDYKDVPSLKDRPQLLTTLAAVTAAEERKLKAETEQAKKVKQDEKKRQKKEKERQKAAGEGGLGKRHFDGVGGMYDEIDAGYVSDWEDETYGGDDGRVGVEWGEWEGEWNAVGMAGVGGVVGEMREMREVKARTKAKKVAMEKAVADVAEKRVEEEGEREKGESGMEVEGTA
ncbi:hypothetical protein EDC01DRAFT_729358 [Geopyxis carbonaria]|nr:hypothetical protein EDC01DRAFT_729358 [Geopyxis carbonaria]